MKHFRHKDCIHYVKAKWFKGHGTCTLKIENGVWALVKGKDHACDKFKHK